ncbi:pentatricopeptide repeat-containing protein [Populus alba x Populus x berolinensis]|nr:pentatricopeptide repeat-containing protein [Populus alba x Populus x berolinensis]
MIAGCNQHGFDNEALQFFSSMLKDTSLKPDRFSLASALSACASLEKLSLGKQIHGYIVRTMFDASGAVGNALISMIMALAQHGLGEEAIELFEQMLALGIKPDHITYVGVLSACTHGGLVEQGRSYFDLMKNAHKIDPTLSHYACMVDLFGRAGLLQEAYKFVENMPMEPDVIAWGSLLSSCKVYKNVDLAKVAAERLLLIEPNNSGAYSALANVYSSCGKWDDAAKIRKLMKARGVKKEQGLSWVQIQNKTHVFGVEDGLHPQKDEIYKMMDKIWKEIKKMGFAPDTESVLHDLGVEVKDQILRYHSEKLAIAFGIISTPENTTLRIMKNLRVCNDCHNAIKFISKLVDREIIVRDATRFHHFKDGSCSCKDYW